MKIISGSDDDDENNNTLQGLTSITRFCWMPVAIIILPRLKQNRTVCFFMLLLSEKHYTIKV